MDCTKSSTSPSPRLCAQSECSSPAAFRFTWPGRDESVICATHVHTLEAVARAMGLHLQVFHLEEVSGHEKPSHGSRRTGGLE